MPSLSGVDLKIARAEHHLKSLRPQLESAVDPRRLRFPMQRDSATGKHIKLVHGVPEIEPAWSITVGECLYNLRCALDHLAWQLVLLDGGTPDKRTSFLIRQSPQVVRATTMPTQLVPRVSRSDILHLLEEVQPYSTSDGRPLDPTLMPLWILNTLCNIDKHRLLLVIACVLGADDMWWGWNPDLPSPSLQIVEGPVTDGSRVAIFDFHGIEPPPNFDAHPTLQIRLMEPTVPRVGSTPLVNLLDTLIWCVKDFVVNFRFRALF